MKVQHRSGRNVANWDTMLAVSLLYGMMRIMRSLVFFSTSVRASRYQR